MITDKDQISSTDLVEQIKELRLLDPAERSDDDRQWLALATELVDQLSAEDLRWGVTLIADSAFRDHAIEVARKSGVLAHEHWWSSAWPMTCIDWDAASADLQADYKRVEVGGGSVWWYLPQVTPPL